MDDAENAIVLRPGWLVIPAEPTQEMLDAGVEALLSGNDEPLDVMQRCWKAFIASAPIYMSAPVLPPTSSPPVLAGLEDASPQQQNLMGTLAHAINQLLNGDDEKPRKKAFILFAWPVAGEGFAHSIGNVGHTEVLRFLESHLPRMKSALLNQQPPAGHA